jgi:tetratricopeptide (TPR) repeat protein
MAVIICLATAAVYFPSLENGFVSWDDDHYVYENPYLEATGTDYIAWSFSTFRLGNWHPMMWLSLGLDYAIWGLEPMGYHLTNILLHALDTFLVVLLAGILLIKGSVADEKKMLFGAAIAGLFFGVHPLHVESVAWVSERKDVLYAFFWILSILAYVGYTSSDTLKRKIMFYVLCLLFFMLSLLSKPMAVTLPVVLMILDFYPLKRMTQKRDVIKIAVWEKTPFLLLSLISSVITIIAQQQGGAVAELKLLSLGDRAWAAVKAMGFYLSKTVFPVNLVPFYSLKTDITVLSFEYLGSLLLILSIFAFSMKQWRRVPVIIAAWTYFLITLLPVLGIVQVGAQAAADRYMYLPILGPLMLLGALGAGAWGAAGKVRYLTVVFAVILASAMSLMTVKQISIWNNSVTLLSYIIEKEPEASSAHNNLGTLYRSQGRFDEAVEEFRTAIRHYPDFTLAHYNLGNAYKDKGDILHAKKAWGKAVAIDPGHAPSLNQLGAAALMSNSFLLAKQYYIAAVHSDPVHAEARYNLAFTLEKLNETDEALKHYEIFLNTASSEYSRLFPKIREKLSQQ